MLAGIFCIRILFLIYNTRAEAGIVRTGLAGSLVMTSKVAFKVLARPGALKETVISAEAPEGISIMFEVMLKSELLVSRALIIRGFLPLLVMVKV